MWYYLLNSNVFSKNDFKNFLKSLKRGDKVYLAATNRSEKDQEGVVTSKGKKYITVTFNEYSSVKFCVQTGHEITAYSPLYFLTPSKTTWSNVVKEQEEIDNMLFIIKNAFPAISVNSLKEIYNKVIEETKEP